MHLELVDLLRCPVPHEEMVLVAAPDRLAARFIIDGLLGCPGCGAEYAIRDGVAWFEDVPVEPVGTVPAEEASTAALPMEAVEMNALRAAAQLDMSEGRAAYALVGHSAAVGQAIRELVPARLFIVNPPDRTAALSQLRGSLQTAPAGIIVCGAVLPFAAGKLGGIGIARRTNLSLASAGAALRARGRLAAPASLGLPSGFREIVRDADAWVAEREGVASAPVELRRR